MGNFFPFREMADGIAQIVNWSKFNLKLDHFMKSEIFITQTEQG